MLELQGTSHFPCNQGDQMGHRNDKQVQRTIQALIKAEKANDLDAQIQGYLKLTHLIGEPAIAHARAACLLQRQHREQEALRHSLKALAFPPNEEVDALLFPLMAQREDILQSELERIRGWYSCHPSHHRRQLLTLALIRHEHFSEAEELITAALERSTQKTPSRELLLTLAHIYYCQKRFHESLACCQIALENSPDSRDAHYTIAQSYNKLGLYKQAIEHYQKILLASPDDIDTHHSLAHLMLKTGNFQKGWEHWEWRWAKSIENQIQNFNIPEWNGEPLEGKRLLVWTEQGIGDQIMFASILPDLCKLTPHIAWECNTRLVPLFSRSWPEVNFIAQPTPTTGKPIVKLWPTSDYHIPAGSLCKILRNEASKFPRQEHFLQASISDAERIRDTYRDLFPKKLLVGISWRGGTSVGTNKYARSLNPAEMHPLNALKNVQLIDLQYGNTLEDRASMEAFGLNVYHDPEIDPLLNLDMQAAQIAALDLVLTVDNTTVHLAGALGTPTYLLLSTDPDWRWGLDQNESYWYPSVTFIRNPNPSNWLTAINTAVELISGITP